MHLWKDSEKQQLIEAKIYNLYLLLSTHPELEIVCSDSAECFDANKAYLKKRFEQEKNEVVKGLIEKDIEFLDEAQIEMSSARQFLFVVRCRHMKDEQILHIRNEVEKTMSNDGFEVQRMNKEDIKRFLALYFDASMNGEQIPDVDGGQYINEKTAIKKDQPHHSMLSVVGAYFMFGIYGLEGSLCQAVGYF